MPVFSLRSLMLVVGLAAIAPVSRGQTILGQWNANTTASYMAASSGTNVATGVAAGYGQSNPAAPFSSVVTTGSPADPGTDVGGTVYNLGYIVNPPLTSAANEAIGLSFKVSTAGMSPGEAVQVRWSQAVGYRSSRYWQLLATTDGTTYSPVPVGTGSSISTTVNGFQAPSPYTPISGPATVTVSSAGLIDFQTINQNSLLPSSTTTAPISPYDVGFVNGITFTLPTGQGFENNPNFGFAIVGAFDPNYVGTDGAVGLLSSFAGTNSSDTVNGYNRSSASGGSMRLDLVTVQAVPEPGSLGLLGGAIVAVAAARRRRATR
jgi:hypothetical protein